MPAVRVGQGGDAVGRGIERVRVAADRGGLVGISLPDDPVDAAHADRAVEPVLEDVLAQVGRHVPHVLEDAAIHVDHVQRPIRSDLRVDGTEAFVGRGQELAFDPVRIPVATVLGDQGRDAVLHGTGREIEVGDDIACRLRHEDVPAEGGGELIAAVDGQSADRGGHCEPAVAAQHAADVAAVDARVHPDRVDRLVVDEPLAGADAAAAGLVLRVREGVVGGNEIGVQVARVRVVVEAADVVLGHAPLAPEERRIDLDEGALGPPS